jgi:hypothetical protein
MPVLHFLQFIFIQASMRRGSAYLIGFLFKNTKLYLADEAPDMMSTLIILMSDTDQATVSVSTCPFYSVAPLLSLRLVYLQL